MSLPAVAQTPPTQGWPANRPPAQPSTTPQVPTQQAPTLAPGTPTPSVPAPGASIVPGTPAPSAPAGQAAAPGAGTPAAVPLPQWFVEIDTAKKGEVTRADFLKYRMKSFEELDANKDAKLSLDEFVKVAEPPFSSDVQGGPNLEERRTRAKAEFQNLDTNRDGFVERGEAEALVHAEFNNYDTDRDNKVTEPEVRLIIQRSLARDAQARQEADQRRRQGMAAINDFIDSQLREADKLDKNGDGKVSQQEYLVLTGPADGPQAQGMLPYEIRKQLVMRKFNEMDSNKDGQLDRVELHGRGSCSTVGGGGGSEALPPPAPRRTTDVDATMTLEVVFYNRRTAEWDTVLQPWSVVGAVRPPPSPPLRRGRVRAHAS